MYAGNPMTLTVISICELPTVKYRGKLTQDLKWPDGETLAAICDQNLQELSHEESN